jgi:hypothetical protein
VSAFVYALFPTGFAVLVSFALAEWGFKNIYYLAQLLPLCMVFYLTLAWFIYLRHEGAFAWLGRRKPPQNILGHHESDLARDLPEDKASGEELRYLRDERGLIFRKQDYAHKAPNEARNSSHDEGQTVQTGSPKNTIGILLWSACQLAVLVTVLYHWFGIGATYY